MLSWTQLLGYLCGLVVNLSVVGEKEEDVITHGLFKNKFRVGNEMFFI